MISSVGLAFPVSIFPVRATHAHAVGKVFL
jgi:hypothetical protein